MGNHTRRLMAVAALATAPSLFLGTPALAHEDTGFDDGSAVQADTAAAAGNDLTVDDAVSARDEIAVHPGESIQEAVDAAQAGDVVHVHGGAEDYDESVVIDKDGISLVGHDAVINPATADQTPCDTLEGEEADAPETPETPAATERVSGICIIGDVELGETEIVVRDAVEETDVSGITVEGAAGEGLIAVGTRDLEVRDSTFRNNAGYGAASFATAGTEETPGTTFQGNTATDNAEAGFYVGDSPEAHAQVSGNESRGNELGLFFRSASNGEATNNVADGNCLGVLVLADAPGPATDWTLRDNEVTENNKACDVVVPLSGGGIALVGAQDFVVNANTVTGNRSSAESLLEGGIIVRSGLTPEEVTPPEAEPPTEPAPPVTEPSGTVSGNTVLDNEPDDLVHDGTGEVTFEDNRCETSDPEGLCD